MELWHLMNRGVDGRDIFMDSGDYVRFVHNLYQMNDAAPALQSMRRQGTNPNVGLRKSNIREKVVEIHAWCLMRNHYHLVLSEIEEGGISTFLRKLNIGYAKYFNERYSRPGTLFAGRTKKVLIKDPAHFLYLLHYVHLNPLDYLQGAQDWRQRSKGTIASTEEALSYLDQYRWSSYLDYIGNKNFPSLIAKGPFDTLPSTYIADLREYLKDADAAVGPLEGLTLE